MGHKALILLGLGERGGVVSAEAQGLAAVRRLPGNEAAHRGLGLTYDRAGRRDEAMVRVEASLRVVPANQGFRRVLECARVSQ